MGGVGLEGVGCFGLGLLNRTSLILTKRKKRWLFLYVGVLQLRGWCRLANNKFNSNDSAKLL